MIICGFPGTGKSMMAKFSRWIDLESTPFERDWERYAKVAKHMSDNGYTVMASTHEELLAEFEKMEVPYTVIIPPTTDKDIYLHRYHMRGNSPDFIKLIDDNWYRWITRIVEKPTILKTVVILPKDGCIEAYAKGLEMTINEMKDYISKSMEVSRKTENESNKKQAVKYREFLSRVLEIIEERDKLQNRCFALSGFGTLCSFCPYECEAKHKFDDLKEANT